MATTPLTPTNIATSLPTLNSSVPEQIQSQKAILLWKFRAVPHEISLKNAYFISTEDCNIRCTGMLHGVGWYLVADVSGQPTGRNFQGSSSLWPLKCPTDTSSQNVYDQPPTYAV